jgi:ketosteroid isomerase-like protein
MTAPPSTERDTQHLELLRAFSEAWNRHDLPALMACMHAECVFDTAAGPQAWGTRHAGPEAVAKAFASAWEAMPDARWNDARHWVAGEQGGSQWRFTGTAADGSRTEVDGVDLFTFRDGRILSKNVFRKQRPALPPL